jgi:hypothetical protein
MGLIVSLIARGEPGGYPEERSRYPTRPRRTYAASATMTATSAATPITT